mmetsp:Transcript_31053/g.68942  ORF Transcript_31053/g.68942 Transcript_31053/m.68942 type:complete len:228 (+) Transcript_31053:351-1034(+)
MMLLYDGIGALHPATIICTTPSTTARACVHTTSHGSIALGDVSPDEGLRGDRPGACQHGQVLEHSHLVCRGLQQGLHALPQLLLVHTVGLSRGSLRLVALPEPHALASFCLSRGHQGLHVLVCSVRGAQHHAMRLDAAHVAGLEVAQHNHGPLLHLLQGHILDEARHDGAGLCLPHVDLLHVQALCIGVALALEDAADTDVHGGHLGPLSGSSGSSSRGCRGGFRCG